MGEEDKQAPGAAVDEANAANGRPDNREIENKEGMQRSTPPPPLRRPSGAPPAPLRRPTGRFEHANYFSLCLVNRIKEIPFARSERAQLHEPRPTPYETGRKKEGEKTKQTEIAAN